MFASKRLGKELQKINRGLPPGIDLVKADDLRQWHMDIRVLDSNPIYKDQVFRLQFVFSNQYPIGAWLFRRYFLRFLLHGVAYHASF